MSQEKLSYEQFLETVDANDRDFVEGLNNYLLDNGCKPAFEEKKTGSFGSYKHTKSKKVIANLLSKKHGLFVRIYGENVSKYPDFLEKLPKEMVE